MDAKYYLTENNQKVGPFTISELEKKEVFKNTLVWTKGLNDWTEARHIPMLKEIIELTPPPIKKNNQHSEVPPPLYSNQTNSEPYFGYKLATRWQRFFASLIETFIVLSIIYILTKGAYFEGDEIFDLYSITIGLIASLIMGGLMYPIFSGNLGHKIFGLKVISKESGEDFNNASKGILREVLKNILGYLIVPIIWIFWDNDKQNLYDKITETIVVKNNK